MPLAFAAVDWWIVGVYVLLATLPGFLCRRFIRGQDDFLVAGRTLSIFLATATLTATEMGLITVMYMAELGFRNGLSAMMLGVIAGVATLVVGLSGFMVSGLRASGVTTVAEYYQKRYGGNVRVFGGLIIAAAGILNYGVFLRFEADFVRIITGMPDVKIASDMKVSFVWTDPVALAAQADTKPADAAQPGPDGESDALAGQPATPEDAWVIPSIKLVMTVLLIVVLLYTLMGGMVSVALTDYVQFIVLSVGMALTTWWILTHPDVGGLKGIVAAVQEHRPGYGMNPFTTQKAATGALGLGLAWVVWQSMHWTGTNTWQTQAFRTAATDSPRTAQTMWTLTAINYFGRAIIPILWGVAALAYFSHHLDSEGFAKLDPPQAMPAFLTHLPTGLVGFLLAGMLAALMSTHSGYLLAWSGVLTEDLVVPIARLLGREVPQHSRIWITRFFILCLGGFLLGWGLWFKAPGAIWNYLAITGTMYISGATALVAMGLYWKRASRTGAYLGLVGGALPGLTFVVLRIVSLIVEPQVREVGYVAQGTIASMSQWLTEAYTGLLSFPLAILGMVVGSLMSERSHDSANGPRVGTGSFMAGGGA